jgi:hypothetical protein
MEEPGHGADMDTASFEGKVYPHDSSRLMLAGGK